MKIKNTFYLFLMIMLFFLDNSGAQTQLEVLGKSTNNSDPVVSIETKATGGEPIGLQVKALSTFASGAADFIGNSFGVSARSTDGVGIFAQSANYYGGTFTNTNKIKPDLVIGGSYPETDLSDNCVLAAEPNMSSSDLYLRGNGNIIAEIDNNNDESAEFQIINGDGNRVLSIAENGIATQTGPQSVIELKSTNSGNGSVLVLNNTSGSSTYTGAINFLNAGGTRGQISYSNSNIMDIRVNLVDAFMQLGGSVNDITMANGAKLTKSGVWTNASPPVSAARTYAKTVDPGEVLEALRVLPIYYWTTKDHNETKHLTPAAEDFYRAFGCGEDDQHLAPSDLAAVALAAVQALQIENEALKNENLSIRTQLTDLESRIQLIENDRK